MHSNIKSKVLHEVKILEYCKVLHYNQKPLHQLLAGLGSKPEYLKETGSLCCACSAAWDFQVDYYFYCWELPVTNENSTMACKNQSLKEAWFIDQREEFQQSGLRLFFWTFHLSL